MAQAILVLILFFGLFSERLIEALPRLLSAAREEAADLGTPFNVIEEALFPSGTSTPPRVATSTPRAAEVKKPTAKLPEKKAPQILTSPAPGIIPEIEQFLAPLLNTKSPPPSSLSSNEIYSLLDTAVVQIVCRAGANLYMSGSGVVVSEAGIVLTNAHVVEGGKDCIVKAGNPGITSGRLDILFIGNTEDKIPDTQVPLEDFALGKIAELTPRSLLKQPFKYMKLDSGYNPQNGDEFYLAAYASELTGGGGILSDKQNLVYTTARLLDSFVTNASHAVPEVIELSGNISTQEGSSGSPVINPKDGSVAALVFGQNKKNSVETSGRTEFAFLISYIDSAVRQSKGKSLAAFIEELGR